MKAVVLAAGEGRRLKPLTNVRPKPMIPVANQPILEYVVEAAIAAGIDELVFVVGYKRDRIQTHFGDGDDWDASIEYVVQEKQLGTGHAVLQAEDQIEGDFVVLNGDRIVDASLVEKLVDVAGNAMAVTSSDHPSDYGVVDLDDGRVTGIVEKPPAYETETDVVNAGAYAFDDGVFDAIRVTDPNDAGETAITATLDAMLASGVRAVWSDDEMRDDVSYLWDLLRVNDAVLDRRSGADHGRIHDAAVVSDRTAVGRDAVVGPNATVEGGCAIGTNAAVGASAVLANAVVMPDATVGDGVVLRDCVVAENATVGPGTTVEGGRSDVVVDGELYQDVRLGAVVGDNARIGGGVALEPGTVLGDRTRVDSGAVVRGTVPPDATVQRG